MVADHSLLVSRCDMHTPLFMTIQGPPSLGQELVVFVVMILSI